MKKIILSLGLIMSCVWAEAQTMKIIVTTPDKENRALAFLKEQGEPFSLAIMDQADKTAFQVHLAREVAKNNSQFKLLKNFTEPVSAQLTCYGYYGNQYNWNNWGWNNAYQPFYNNYGWGNGYSNYNGWGTSWGQNYYRNQSFGMSGIGFGLYFGFF